MADDVPEIGHANTTSLPIGIAFSNTVSLFKKARELGVDYVLAKEIQGSNMESILERMDTFLYHCRDATSPPPSAPGVRRRWDLIQSPSQRHVLRRRQRAAGQHHRNLGAVIIFAVINTLCRMYRGF